MEILIIVIVLLLGFILLIVSRLIRKKLVTDVGDVIYSDSSQLPGELLYAKSIPLVGKPDFIFKKEEKMIPVEIKRGKTPREPYRNHIAQLYAYCMLIKEAYGVRPEYGIIKYPDKEFTLVFPDDLERNLTKAVNEMLEKKKKGISRQDLKHICRQCRMHE
jgi:CRISPR-associated exonuclease Cas4